MKPIFREIDKKYIEVIGHYDNPVLCAKLTLLAELYAVEHKEGYALFKVEDYDKLSFINDKLEFSVSDLTGTTWVINSNPTINPPSIYVPGIGFISNNKQYSDNTVLYIGYIPELDADDDIWYGENDYVYNKSNGWTNQAYRTITFTGGTGVTNANLIAWLQANATQQEPEPEPTGINNLFIGSSAVSSIFVGSSEISKIFIGNFEIYNAEGGGTVSYSITTSVTNGTYSGDSTIDENGTATVTVAADSGYQLPSTITVTGASYTYDSSTGVISLSSPTSNVSISVVMEQQQLYDYTITKNATDCTINGDSGINANSSTTLTIVPNTGYTFPNSTMGYKNGSFMTLISVSGATMSYDKTNGTIAISNPTGNVTVTANCVAICTVSFNIMHGHAENSTIQVAENEQTSVHIYFDNGYKPETNMSNWTVTNGTIYYSGSVSDENYFIINVSATGTPCSISVSLPALSNLANRTFVFKSQTLSGAWFGAKASYTNQGGETTSGTPMDISPATFVSNGQTFDRFSSSSSAQSKGSPSYTFYYGSTQVASTTGGTSSTTSWVDTNYQTVKFNSTAVYNAGLELFIDEYMNEVL